MKRLAAVVALTLLVLGLSACNKVSGPKTSSSAKISESSSTVKQVKVVKTTDTNWWSQDQDQELSEFMSSWQADMSQSFKGTYDGEQVTYYGHKYPSGTKTIDDASIGGLQAHYQWNHKGNMEARYVIVAAAVGGKSGASPILYLFAIDSNQSLPVVLVSQSGDGEILTFAKTQNTELQNGFWKIAGESTGVIPMGDTSAAYSQATASSDTSTSSEDTTQTTDTTASSATGPKREFVLAFDGSAPWVMAGSAMYAYECVSRVLHPDADVNCGQEKEIAKTAVKQIDDPGSEMGYAYQVSLDGKQYILTLVRGEWMNDVVGYASKLYELK